MNSKQFSLALSMATETHAGTNDRGGKPYILHPLRIMMRLRTDDLHLMALALMHDVVEDSSVSFKDLLEQGFSEEFVADLRLLTRSPGEEYMDYIEKMRGNRRVLLIKEQDLRDNSDITRLKGVSEKDIARMVKYQTAFVKVREFLTELNA